MDRPIIRCTRSIWICKTLTNLWLFLIMDTIWLHTNQQSQSAHFEWHFSIEIILSWAGIEYKRLLLWCEMCGVPLICRINVTVISLETVIGRCLSYSGLFLTKSDSWNPMTCWRQDFSRTPSSPPPEMDFISFLLIHFISFWCDFFVKCFCYCIKHF